MFQTKTDYLSRYGLLTGTEEAFAAAANYDGTGINLTPDGPGLRADGGIFVSASNSSSAGASYSIPAALTGGTYIPFPVPNFGNTANQSVTYGSIQYNFNVGQGNIVIPVLNRVQEMSGSAWLAEQDNVGIGCSACPGPSGSGIIYVASPDVSGLFVTFSKVLFDGSGFVSNTIIGTVAIGDVNPLWFRSFGVLGMCMDKTDSKLLVMFQGVGHDVAQPNGALCKVNPATLALDWIYIADNGHGFSPSQVGPLFSCSDIRHQRVALFVDGQVTIVDTSDGSVDVKYTTGLAGFFTRSGGQAYSDSLGALVLSTDFTQVAGSPTLLNSTPTSWSDGYCVLYVAEAPTPPTGGTRRLLAHMGPVRSLHLTPVPPVTPTDAVGSIALNVAVAGVGVGGSVGAIGLNVAVAEQLGSILRWLGLAPVGSLH